MMRSFLAWFVLFFRLPHRLITRDDGKPYLHRWYLCGEPGGLKYFEEGQREMRWWQRAFAWLPCIYVHRFVASDDDVELHNHPWEATSLIVVGGYREERGYPFKRSTFFQVFRPWSINRIYADTFHKVTLLEEDCWSIIKCGAKIGTWGFLNVETDEFHHWRAHVAKRAKRMGE